MDWEAGIGLYTLLYIKLINNKDLLDSLGKSIQYSVIVYMEKESEKEHIYMADSVFCTSETETAFQVTYTPIKFI